MDDTHPAAPGRSSWLSLALACFALLLSAAPAANAQCTPTWLELAGLPGFDQPVAALGVLNDGSGDKLYAGGSFTVAGGDSAPHAARYDGSRWSVLGEGFNTVTYTGAIFNGELYAGGDFTASGATPIKRVARWTGSAWQQVGAGFDNGGVNCLLVFNNELYAAGSFTTSGGVACAGIAKWTGSAWQQVGDGLNNWVYCLAVYQDQLYAGGIFTASGATSVSNIARFDGSAWQPLLGGVTGGSTVRGVYSLLVFNGELHAAGGFTSVNGASCPFAARWNGSAWTNMPFPSPSGASNGARALAIYNNELYCGGTMAVTGGIYLARWNGSAWVNVLGSIFNTPSGVISLAAYQGYLYIGGRFQRLNDNAYNYIVRYDGSAFSQVGDGFDLWVNAMAEFNNQLVIGGRFITAGGFPAFHIVRYDGEHYLPMGNELLGDGTDIETNDFCIHNNELYAAGQWTLGGSTKRVAKWNGSAWVALPAQPIGKVDCIASFNGNLVIGGFGVAAGSVNVLRYDGTAWVPMGNGLNNEVFDLYPFNGSLYAGGQFSASGATPMSFVARWDGSQWNPVGGSVAAPGTAERAWTFTTFNNQLVVGGGFTTLGGIVVNGVARLSANTWTPFATGFINGGPVRSLSVLNGSLIASGVTRPSGVTTATLVARWDGAAWIPIGQNFSGFRDSFNSSSSVHCSLPFQNELFIGGDFFKAGGRVSSFVAHWGSEPPCVQSSPQDTTGCPAGGVALSAFATGVPALTYQWRKNLSPLADGPTPSGSVIAGAQTRTLSINGLSPADIGNYDLLITNAFGSATSNPAHLDVACCPDFNDDGNADQDDIRYLVNVIGGGNNPSGHDPDFNADGNVDQTDIAALVDVIGGGPCP